MAAHRNILKSETEYTRSYENMRGISSSPGKDRVTSKFLYTENMYVDREAGDGAVESIPGYRAIYSFGERINGIFVEKPTDSEEYVLVHAGTKLYRFAKASYDSLTALEPIAELEDARSRAFVYGRSTYIIDGAKMLLVNGDGTVTEISESSTDGCYVPTTYRNGIALEERNLLTKRFKEETLIPNSAEVTFGSPELLYSVTDGIKMTCSVVGVGEREAGPLYIPAKAVIGGRSYTVTEIAPSALRDNTTVTELITSEGLERICKYALWGATALTRVSLSQSVTDIEKYAFCGCSALEYLLLGIGTESLGENMLKGCDALSEIRYTGDAEGLKAVLGTEELGERETVFTAEERAVSVAVKVHTPVEGMTRVTVDGENVPFTFIRSVGEIVLSFSDRSSIDGKLVTVYGNAEDTDIQYRLFGESAEGCTPSRAILGCRVCEVFDGRIFLSGNPALGGAVFYSTKDRDGKPHPLYFGIDSCFVDGAGGKTVSALLTDDDELAVFKSGEDGSGSVFYHEPSGKDTERSYPVHYVHSNSPCLGEAYRFLDRAVFMGSLGLSTLKRTSSDYKELLCLSADISPLLCRENFGEITITEWLGYLVLSAGGNMYLADATRHLEGEGDGYDWYYVTGVGYYQNTLPVYRFSEETPEGYATAQDPGAKVTGTVYSTAWIGKSTYYTIINGKKVAVVKTDEKEGGTLSPAVVVKGDGKLLLFGTESGELCVFNNDKRGVAPSSVKAQVGFNEEEYLAEMGCRIHPSFYTFGGVAPRYAVLTAHDDCETGYLEKQTTPHSLVLKLKNFDTGRLYCDVVTDKGGARSFGLTPSSTLSFSDMRFDSFSAMTRERSVISIDDRSQGWTEKQIAVYTDEYASPFGIYSIYYRYKIKGKLKKTTT